MTEAFQSSHGRSSVPGFAAVERRLKIDWPASPLPRPAFLGARVLRDFPLADLVPYIDWSPFFMAWELKGKYPQILSDPEVGPVARELFDDAQKLLRRIVAERWLQHQREQSEIGRIERPAEPYHHKH